MANTNDVSFRCIACGREFFIDDIIKNEDGEQVCPYCMAERIEPYSGDF